VTFWPYHCHMKYILLSLVAFVLLFSSCVKDDFIDDSVDPVLRIMTVVDTIGIDTIFQFNYSYLNEIGIEEDLDVTWTSSDLSILTINEEGLCQPQGLGNATIKVEAANNPNLSDSVMVVIDQETVAVEEIERTGTLQTTTFYTLEGDFIMKEQGDQLILEFADNYAASSSLPGLYVYLTNNPNTISGAFEIGVVDVFSGAHSYTIDGVGINDFNYVLYFCAPFNVKVGDGQFDN